MNIPFIFNLSIILSLSIFASMCYSEQAVVINPVIDLIGSPIAEFFPHADTAKAYQEIPVCGAQKNAWNNCPRLHQLLCNEIVEVLEEKNNEVKIKVPDIFYVTGITKDKHNVFWTLKSNLAPLKTLQNSGVSISLFPGTAQAQKLITLIKPFKVLKTDITYSAGTRFVVDAITSTTATAYIFNAHKNNFEKTLIPRSFFCIPSTDHAKKIETFLQLARNWSQEKYIPYVWGGCSFINTHKQDFLNTGTSYTRDTEGLQKTGFDCAGLVLRAAKTAGFEYPYKNTTTLKELLPALGTNDIIKNGDLIWISGHVMIVSDVTKNKLIEARSYPHGYGIVHEIELKKVFKDIHTYDQLRACYCDKKALYRIDSNKQIRDTIKDFKLLRLYKDGV